MSETALLYMDDSYLREFEAVVLDVTAEGDVILDQTAFYPTGGGQPNDTGRLIAGDLAWDVVDVRKRGATVLHRISGEGAPEVGQQVRGEIDWDRRYKLMRTHTALHVLCGVIFKEYGAPVTGANIQLDKARMDFELEDLNPERVERIETLVNEAIERQLPVSWRTIPREEAFQIPDLIRTKINLLPEHITEVRVVEIEGLDLQADGGTHVRNTSEIGGLRVVGTRSKGKSNKRIEVEIIDR
ncbi:MAG TPA: alanyl-tRNA editing protein AlaXM [Thermomicrobiales bacterium]|nr:alanyl-tRNA editing protein AlaXM [Thermomicrobiales bacterium]